MIPPAVRSLLDRYRIDVRILVGFLAFAGTASLFLLIAGEMSEGETHDFDRWLMLGLRNAADPAVPIGPEWLRVAMIDITALGGWAVLTLVTLLAAGYLLAIGKRSTAWFVLAASVSGALLGNLLKLLFDRSRPDLVTHLVEVNSASFPSGHAMHSAIIYLTLAALLAGAQRGHRVKIFLLSAAVALTALIGFSRVYLGVHWPSDVLAGWSIGASWALGCALLAYVLRRRRSLDPASPAADGQTSEPL